MAYSKRSTATRLSLTALLFTASLRYASSGNKWLDVAMIRMNHNGAHMDAEDFATSAPGNVSEVTTHGRKSGVKEWA